MEQLIENDVRVDKWLWAVRIYKTRTLAADACRKNQVTIDGVDVKPSRVLKVGDELEIRMPPISKRYKVKGLLAKRLSAPLVKEYVEEITSPEEYAKLEMMRLQRGVFRDPGAGRPSKKDRRDLERLGYIDDAW